MTQTTKITVEVTLTYNDNVISEHEAQQVFLERGLLTTAPGMRGTTVHHAEITKGLVDKDGMPS